MGIQGLLPFLKPIQQNVHINKFRGQTLAVDSYVWLHRGAFTCAVELGTGVATTKYVGYCMKMVQMLLHHDIKPIMVFDGGSLPMKAPTERYRSRRREENRRLANQYMRSGQKSKAYECFQQCVDVTPRMAAELIKVLRKENIECIVAPYEADAQIAYLVKNGLADAAITEDSDLLVFGCEKVIFKLEKDGNAVEINIDDFGGIRGMESWTHRRFRQMCILSGCDYLESPSGIGIKKAHALLKHKYADEVMRNWKWGRAVNAPKCPDGYAEMFRMAELTFLHQRVYDPRTGELVHLTPLSNDLSAESTMMDFLGPDIAPHLAKGIADGLLDPNSKLPFLNTLDAKPHVLSTVTTTCNTTTTCSFSATRRLSLSHPADMCKENTAPAQFPVPPPVKKSKLFPSFIPTHSAPLSQVSPNVTPTRMLQLDSRRPSTPMTRGHSTGALRRTTPSVSAFFAPKCATETPIAAGACKDTAAKLSSQAMVPSPVEHSQESLPPLCTSQGVGISQQEDSSAAPPQLGNPQPSSPLGRKRPLEDKEASDSRLTAFKDLAKQARHCFTGVTSSLIKTRATTPPEAEPCCADPESPDLLEGSGSAKRRKQLAPLDDLLRESETVRSYAAALKTGRPPSPSSPARPASAPPPLPPVPRKLDSSSDDDRQHSISVSGAVPLTRIFQKGPIAQGIGRAFSLSRTSSLPTLPPASSLHDVTSFKTLTSRFRYDAPAFGNIPSKPMTFSDSIKKRLGAGRPRLTQQPRR